MVLEPGTLVERYVIERALGEGGMAVVYEARHVKLGSRHALKVLKVPVAVVQERLQQEGRVQARLNHPHVVSVTDMVEVDGAPGLVMEFVEGSSLQTLLRTHRLSFQQIDLLARGLLEGVAAAHDAGLIHRDLKPANVLLSTAGGGIHPKITDFGLAKLLGAGGSAIETRSGLSMGTPAYMAPEQIESAKSVDQRADVFSLGVILFEMVCGERPFQGSSTLKILNAVAEGDRRQVRETVENAPQRMVDAIDAALRVRVEDRPTSCGELLRLWEGDQTPVLRSGVWGEDLVREIRQSSPSLSLVHSSSAGSEVPSNITQALSSEAVMPEVQPDRRLLGATLIGLGILVSAGAYLGLSDVPELPDVPSGTVSVEAAPSPAVQTDPIPDVPPVAAPTPTRSAPQPPPPLPPNMAALTFDSVPSGATVFLDDLRIGKTPLRDFAVPRGRHRLRMTHRDRESSTRIGVNKRSSRHWTWTMANDSWSDE